MSGAYIPAPEPLDPDMLIPIADIGFSVERFGRAVIVRKHYPPHMASMVGESRLPPAIRLYPGEAHAKAMFRWLERHGHRACLEFYYRARRDWQDRERANAWEQKPRALETSWSPPPT